MKTKRMDVDLPVKVMKFFEEVAKKEGRSKKKQVESILIKIAESYTEQ